MPLTPLHTPDAPEAIGPYSQAMRYGNLIQTSGQIASRLHAASKKPIARNFW